MLAKMSKDYLRDSSDVSMGKTLNRLSLIWGPRLTPHGDFGIASRAMHEYREEFLNNGGHTYLTVSRNAGSWKCLGPTGGYAELGSRSTQGVGRIHRLAFDPNFDWVQNRKMYATTGFGGLWQYLETGDGVWAWTSLNTDLQIPVTSVGDIAVSQQDGDILYISTGTPDEGFAGTSSWAPLNSRLNPVYTMGIYRSMDGGQTWEHISDNGFIDDFRNGGTVRAMLLNPHNDNQLFAATTRGIYRTNNAKDLNGPVWERVFEGWNALTEVGDSEFRGLAFKPTHVQGIFDTTVVYASGVDIYRSLNNGEVGSWASMTDSLADLSLDQNPVGDSLIEVVRRINIATPYSAPSLSPAGADKLYAHVMTSFVRVVPNGDTLGLVDDKLCIYAYDGLDWSCRYSHTDTSGGDGVESVRVRRLAIAVSPVNENAVYLGDARVRRDLNIMDTILHFTDISGYGNLGIHPDIHDLAFAPNIPGLMFCAHDGGVSNVEVAIARPDTGWTRMYGGLQIAKVWGFDDSEMDAQTIIGGMQDTGTNGTKDGGYNGVWTYIAGGDGYGVRTDDYNHIAYLVKNGTPQRIDLSTLTSVFDTLAWPSDPFPRNLDTCNFYANDIAYAPWDPNFALTFTKAAEIRAPVTFPLENHPITGEPYWGISELFIRKVPTEIVGFNQCDNWGIKSNLALVADIAYESNPLYDGGGDGRRDIPTPPGMRNIQEIAIAEANPDYIYLSTAGVYNIWPNIVYDGDPLDELYVSNYLGHIEPKLFLSTTGGCDRQGYTYFESTCFVDRTPALIQSLDTTYTPVLTPRNDSTNNLPRVHVSPIISGIAVDPKDEERVWVSFAHFDDPDVVPKTKRLKVWFSEDAGLTWLNADSTGSLPNVGINAIVYQSGTADRIYVGTDVGVYTREASDTDWVRFGNIPNVRVTEMEIHHCSGKLRASTFGRGIWEADLLAVESLDGAMTISGYEEWNEKRSVERNIRIPSGSTLVIRDTVGMPYQGRIIVEKGGELIVRDGVLTNLCDERWYGIVVEGDGGVVHPDSIGIALNTPHPDHGVVVLDGATLEHAREAVTLCGFFGNGTFDIDKSGGIVLAEHSTFRNCRRAAAFMKFQPTASADSNDNASYFLNCTFERDAQTRTSHQYIEAFVTMWAVDGVSILDGCTFVNHSPEAFDTEYRGKGIKSINANYFVMSPNALTASNWNMFRDLFRGIEALGICNSDALIEIDRNAFGGCIESMVFDGLQNQLVVTNNTIDMGIDSYQESCGIYLQGCMGYNIEDNDITAPPSPEQPTVGIYVRNQDSVATELYRNTIYDVDYGIVAEGENRGLQIDCNVFEDVNRNNILAFHVVGGNLAPSLGHQGACLLPGTGGEYTAPIGNVIYDGACISGSDHVLIVSPLSVQYNHFQDIIGIPRYGPQCASPMTDSEDCLVGYDSLLSCPINLAGRLGQSGGFSEDTLIYLEEVKANAKSKEELYYYSIQKDLFVRDAVLHHLKRGEVEEVIQVLEGDESEYAARVLLPIYVEQRKWQEAEGLYGRIPVTPNNKSFRDFYQWMLRFHHIGNPYTSMTSSQEDSLRMVADGGGMYAYNAKVILDLAFGEEIEHPYEFLDESGFRLGQVSEEDVATPPLLVCSPNPAEGKVEIRYAFPEDEGVSYLEIHTAQGEPMYQSTLDASKGTMLLDVSSFAMGIYFVHIRFEDKVLASQKLVIVH